MSAEVTNVPLEMLVIFGAAKLLAELFERLKQPAIVGEILAGILIGPSALGWITPGPVLSAFADLGVLFLLFEVGLEVRTRELLRVGRVATQVAILGVIAPFVLGFGLMSLWGGGRPAAFFVAASMVATSVGITARVLSSRGLLHEVASQIILAAAVIDDVLGLIVLAVVTSLARDQVRILELLATAALAMGFTAVIAKWGTRTVAILGPRLVSRLQAGDGRFNVAMLLLFALSVAAADAGIAAIVGAFLAGMSLSDTADERIRGMTHGVAELMVPFFLVNIGMRLDLNIFSNVSTLALAFVILGAAVASKLIGCGLGAIQLGRRNMLRVGVGMVPRGEVGIVVAQLGMSMGVVTRPIYTVVVFMAVATTLIAPPLLNIAFRDPPAPEPRSDDAVMDSNTYS